MKVTKYDSYIKEIKIEEVEIYLESLGWSNNSKLGDFATIWSNESFPNEEILLPLSMDLRDSSRRLIEIVRQLSSILKKNEEDILDEIISLAIDVIRIRIIHQDVSEGAIPINDGVLLFERSRDLLIAATRATIEKKKYFAGRMSDDLNLFIEKMKFGQTEKGSYIVNILSPLSNQRDEQIDHNAQSLTRSVSTTLSRGLKALNQASNTAEEQVTEEVLENLIEYGVSANLCDALIGLSGHEEEREISINISLGKSEISDDEVQLEHNFNSNNVPFWKKISNYYKEILEFPNHTISGHVIKLHHEENESFGEITLGATVNGLPKSVSLQLNAEYYWEAHAAHKSGMIVECIGNLLITPRSAKLIEVSNFRVFGTTDFFEE